jgi:prevent-host-death family protein
LTREGFLGEHTFVDNPNHKGNVAELAIATEAARLGLSVLKPLTEHERYDLVLGIAGRLLRVQCKWASCRDGVVRVRLSSSYHSPTRGYVKATYAAEEVDAIAVHCGELARSFLLPIELFAGRSTVYLRLSRARNNQRAALNWAADYEFSGAVAQLEERCHGMAEVRGSSPLSSIPEESRSTSSVDVGAHLFRNHLGRYLEQAHGGAEILISRRGRPYARLVPPDLNAGASAADG